MRFRQAGLVAPRGHEAANHHGGSIWDQVSSRGTCQAIPHARPFRDCWRLSLPAVIAQRIAVLRHSGLDSLRFSKCIKDAVFLHVFVEAIIGHQAV